MSGEPRPGGKHPRSLLAGPYGHPLHPIAVILPIAAWTSSVVFDVAAVIAPDPAPFALGAHILVVIGLIGAAIAVVLGVIDWLGIPPNTPARRTGTTHMILNLVAAGVFAGTLPARSGEGQDAVLPLMIGVAGLCVLGVSGWLGGKLAHTYGVRVADERTQAEGLVRTHDSPALSNGGE